MGLRRVELLTSRLSGVRSNQLSYRPSLLKLIQLLLLACSRSVLSAYLKELFLQKNRLDISKLDREESQSITKLMYTTFTNVIVQQNVRYVL